ncbi:MAG: hypothetical protein NC331_03910 [Lachnospiraceae bacterium]|nr:hypothetical protein [Lachnospiraceae bacterium]MCM1302965.1 hypothetical protein [Butyrivibrio sp.]MCM1343037.1 hypothetical protein [Muribaculaceae bacterium]MCM1215618.1 hypothetical protein [Lachnospiraceae bacterium]MCM1238511.1 hypothetical protein [Lachnospiraceae bacterium]
MGHRLHPAYENHYEAERTEKLEQKGRLSSELEAYRQETDDVQQWMTLIQEYL